MKRNCYISLSGKEGHDLAMDEFVEKHLVKPLKSYVTGKSNCLFIYLILAMLFFMYNVNDNVQHYVLM
jgi:hypothetical protein